MKNSIKKLMLVQGTCGKETEMCEAIKKEIEPFADEIFVDAMGNLIAHKCGNGKKIMFAAHMDEQGYFTTFIEKDGAVRISPIGAFTCAPCEVVSENGVFGVLTQEKSGGSASNFYIDIGAKNLKQASDKVKTGDFFSPVPKMKKLLNSKYVVRQSGNRLSCAVLCEAAKEIKNSGNDLFFVFTSQREAGSRGAKTAAYGIMPDICIAVDVTEAAERGSSCKTEIKLGGGCAIKIKDSSIICSAELVSKMREIAVHAKIKFQNEVSLAGGGDASPIQVTGTGCMAGAVSVPCAHVRSLYEIIDMNDVKEVLRLLCEIAERI